VTDPGSLIFALPGALCGAGAAFGTAYTLLASAMIGRFFARRAAQPEQFPPVTIVKPLHGREWALLSNLSSFCTQDYPGPVQYLFGVSDPQDPALQTIEELRRLHPEAEVTIVANPRLHGANRKVSNLINMLAEARHEILVFADSDVGVQPDYLRQVVGELHKPGVALVTCVYRGAPDPGFWPRISAMATNYGFLPNVVAGVGLGRARPCCGQTIALRTETLEAVGGFRRFANHLAEDHALGEAVRAIGGIVAIPPFAVSHACVETTFKKLFLHELRWSRTIRAVDPSGHLGSALSHPLAFALMAIAFSGGARWSWLLAALALIARLTLKVRVDSALRQPVRDAWLLPPFDLLAFVVFAASFFAQRVLWRGHAYRVDRDGMLTAISGESAAHE
jgi:ceramide glucosyltransferase